MAGLLETLTVRIEGDSSGLSRELDRVVSQVEGLGSRLAEVGGRASGLERVRDGLSQAVGPAERLGRQLDLVSEKLAGIGRIPVTINTAPALSALAGLNASLDATTAKLNGLSQGAGGGWQGGLPGWGGGGAGSGVGGGVRGGGGIAAGASAIPKLASGGVVRGPEGWDRVPAWLTAGEFVVGRPAVEAVGLEFLEALNRPGVGSSGGLSGGAAAGESRREVLVATKAGEGLEGGVEARRGGRVGGEREVLGDVAASDGVMAGAMGQPLGEGLGDEGLRRKVGPGEREGGVGGGGVVNQFGGVTIQVKEVMELGRVLGELRRQGVGSRLRRGS